MSSKIDAVNTFVHCDVNVRELELNLSKIQSQNITTATVKTSHSGQYSCTATNKAVASNV